MIDKITQLNDVIFLPHTNLRSCAVQTVVPSAHELPMGLSVLEIHLLESQTQTVLFHQILQRRIPLGFE